MTFIRVGEKLIAVSAITEVTDLDHKIRIWTSTTTQESDAFIEVDITAPLFLELLADNGYETNVLELRGEV